MTESTSPWPTEAPATDALLRTFLHLAETQGLSVPLTLLTRGGVITGTLVGTITWVRAMADQAQRSPGNAAQQVADGLRGAAEVAEQHQRFDDSPGPWFVHLTDARFVYGEVLTPGQGSLWRIRLHEVAGWTQGNFVPGAAM